METTAKVDLQHVLKLKDPQTFIRQQCWASVCLDGDYTLMELRSLYEHLQARILELIETLDTLHASPDYEVFLFVEKEAIKTTASKIHAAFAKKIIVAFNSPGE